MTTSVRAAIMLAVLVGLPAAWVYYGPLPPRAQCVIDRVVAAAKDALGKGERLEGESDELVGGTVAEATSPAIVAPPVASAASLAQSVEPLLARLRAWGVAEYRLESWGTGQSMFRFCCEMPLADGAPATEQFDAVAVDPQTSIEQVVAQVASWQASRVAVR